MTNTTATATPASVATKHSAQGETFTADSFRAALAAASHAGNTNGVATRTLYRATVDRYRAAIATLNDSVGTLDGTTVLRDSSKRDVSMLVWLEATGSLTAPKTNDRTSGETSLGQYLSKLGTVATSAAYGIKVIESGPDSVESAYDALGADNRKAKELKEDRAFTVWIGTESPETKAAFDLVTAIMATDNGKAHKAAFVRSISFK